MTEAPGGAEGSRAPRVGMYGGTFDPPHRAHLALAEAARRSLDLDRVVFVPAGDPWRKRDQQVTPALLRLELVRALVADLAWAEVSAHEVDHDGPSYTHETLDALIRPGEQWWFILGADALADMPHWRDPQRILALSRIAVARRPDSPDELPPPEVQAALPGIEERLDVVEMPPMDISATEIRRRIASDESTEDLVPPAVRQVIDDLGLYREPRE